MEIQGKQGNYVNKTNACLPLSVDCNHSLTGLCGYRNPEEFWSAHIGSEVAVRSENSPPPAEEDQFTCLRLLVEAAVAVSQRDHVAA